jgi:amino acid adenylation domain-containing protein/thioester reductase-like protein
MIYIVKGVYMNNLTRLTRAQKRIWYAEMTYMNTAFACLSNIVRYKEKIEATVLKKAINLIIKNNEGLRLRLVHSKDGTDDAQYCAQYEPHEIETWDYSNPRLHGEIEERLKREAALPFKLYDSPLYKFAIIDFGADGSGYSPGVFFKLHHFVSDGWTIALIYNQLLEYCKLITAGREAEIEANPSYFDYLKYEEDYFNSGRFKEDEKFWAGEFEKPLDECSLNYDRPRADSIAAKRSLFIVPDDIRSLIHKFKDANATTVYKVILSSIFVYIARARAAKNILISTVSHGRSKEFYKTAGMFVSTMPLRVEIESGEGFGSILRRAGDKLNTVIKNYSKYPFDELIERLRETNNSNADTLLSAIAVIGHPDDDNCDINFKNIYQQNEPTPLVIHINANGLDARGQLELLFDYQTELFTCDEIKSIFGSLCAVLKDALMEPDKSIDDIELFGGADKELVIKGFNRTESAYDCDKTLYDLFELSCKKYPGNTAVVYDGVRLSYGELALKAGLLAEKLAGAGAGPEKICAIYAARSHYYLIAILAVLKTGAAYMPLDSSYPAERVEFMLNDAGAALLLVSDKLRQAVNYGAPSFKIDDESLYEAEKINERAARPCPRMPAGESFREAKAGPANLAYVIYTSGSTGRPKGVMIEHRAAVNMICWSRDHYEIKAGENCAEFASFAFDASVVQIFSPLSRGAALHILKDELRFSPQAANDYFEANAIVYTDLPTQFCEEFIRSVSNHSLRCVSTGGEKFKMPRESYNFRLTDEYGPTECTIVSTYYDIPAGVNAKTPIGRPIANTRACVLDDKKRPVPLFMPGELYLAGAGLARGYLNRPELTAEKFIDDPFIPGEKMYKTGDLARFLSGGNIDYLGRADSQVKIRGFRVELEEIQNELQKDPRIKSAAVICSKSSSGDDFISAHIALNEPGALITGGELKKNLGESLPAYMIPSRFYFIDKIPLTSSGKIDKKALAAAASAPANAAAQPDGGSGVDSFRAPQSETEIKIAAVWSDLLNIKRIGAADNFFELGGHSLKAASLQGYFKKLFGAHLSLLEILKTPVLCDQAALVDKKAGGPAIAIEHAAAGRESYPLSAAQKRLFIIESMGGAKKAYNLTSAFMITGSLDEKRLAKAFDLTVKRRDALRARFVIENGVPAMIIENEVKYKRDFIKASENELDSIVKEFARPFDISKAPLFRILLVELPDGRHLFVFDAHHIIIDGISISIIIKDICAIYDGLAPDKSEYDFCDYTLWEEKYYREGLGARCEKYWLDRFAGDIAALELPVDRPRGAAISYEGARAVKDISALAPAVEKLTARYGVTDFSLLLSFFFTALHKFSGQSDIITGVPAAGRGAIEFENTAGMFVTTLALRAKPSAEIKFGEFASDVKHDFTTALDNSGFQFDSLVEKLGVRREAGRNPLFDVMFAFERGAGSALKASGIELEPFIFDPGISKFDLTLFCIASPGRLELVAEYKTSLFNHITAERFLDAFSELIKSAAQNPDASIGELNAVSEGARHFLLDDFNPAVEEAGSEKSGNKEPGGAKSGNKEPGGAKSGNKEPGGQKLLIDLIEQTAASMPEAAALLCDGAAMSYAEANSKAEKLARLLREKHGAAPGALLAILTERSFETVIAILAVLKTGAAYVPIDPSYPAERIEYILDDSGAKTLLTQSKFSGAYSGRAAAVVEIDSAAAYESNAPAFTRVASMEDIIYVIYTSGSTGRPKGVLVKNKGAFNYISWCKRVYAQNSACDFPLYSSISFDLTVTSIFTPLICGGKVVIYPEKGRDTLIDKIINDDCVDIVKLTPTHLQIIESMQIKCRRINKLIVGGEDLKTALCEKIYEKFNGRVSIFNEYGPTETTVGCMIYLYSPADSLSGAPSLAIGSPAANTAIYILNGAKNLLPPGAKGELYISGAGVARGYHNKAGLTGGRFTADPFRPGEFMYKSGDLARLKPDGNIEFLGRIDEQVKLRGYRIETGEIEAELARHQAVREAAVVLRNDARRGDYLAAYYTLKDGAAKPAAEELRALLSARLPQYFVPDAFTQLDKIPLTPNAKTDKKALPDPFSGETANGPAGVHFIEPAGGVEKKVAAVWRSVLGVDKISADDNFFSLGGHSLKAIKAVMELSDEFEITLNDIFVHQSVRALAAAIKPAAGNLTSKLNKLKYFKAEIPKLAGAPEDKLDSYLSALETYKTMNCGAAKRYDAILLCGATGFLGSYLLNRILTGRGETVHMIIRAADSAEAFKRLEEKYSYYFGGGSLAPYLSRVKVYAGDLGRDRLGLSAEDYSRLAETIDCVFNSAANVRHFGHYEQFHEANVVTVENLVKFCRDKKLKDLNHVSTMSVCAGDIEGSAVALFTEDDTDIGQRSGNYYLETKLAGEKAAIAARDSGVCVNIFRAGNLTFDSKSGLCQQNIDENAFYRILKSIALLGAVPDTLDDAEFSFVDCAARAMLLLFDKKELAGGTYHIRNDKPQKLSRLLSAPDSGLDMRVTSFSEFIELLIRQSGDGKLKPLIDDLIVHRGWDNEMNSKTLCCMRSDRTNLILNRLGFSWREASGADCYEMLERAFAERIDIISRHKLFDGVSREDASRFALMSRAAAFEDNEEITWENTALDSAHIVTEGFAEVSAHSKNMWIGTIKILSEGGLIGFETALSGGKSQVITSAALGKLRSLYVSRENLIKFARGCPQFMMNLGANFAGEIVNYEKLIVNMG